MLLSRPIERKKRAKVLLFFELAKFLCKKITKKYKYIHFGTVFVFIR